MPGKSLENMHVAVLAGGHSAEREISLNSGKNVVVALKEAGYTSVELLDTAADDFMVTMATGGFDVAFIAMHGAGGEDGAMQGAMETLGIPYTASGVLASARHKPRRYDRYRLHRPPRVRGRGQWECPPWRTGA